jgi:hypothetical protein
MTKPKALNANHWPHTRLRSKEAGLAGALSSAQLSTNAINTFKISQTLEMSQSYSSQMALTAIKVTLLLLFSNFKTQ